MICDKVYKIVMRPAMMYGQCHCLLTKRQEAKVEVLTFSLVVSRMDWRGEQFGDKVIIETCLRWFRRAEDREWTYGTKDAKRISQRRFGILEMEADDPLW